MQAHTVIIYIIMLMSIFVVYTTSFLVGSPERMWELLREAAALHPVVGNAEGSYLTMRSQGQTPMFPSFLTTDIPQTAATSASSSSAPVSPQQ
jgi:Na+/proline symporter